jgi:hypothetical protein
MAGACRPGGRACQNPAVSDLNYLADCLRRIPSYQIYSQSTLATGVPDRTCAPASGSALSILPRRQYQLLGAKMRLAALLGHGSDLSMFGQSALPSDAARIPAAHHSEGLTSPFRFNYLRDP